MKQQLTLLRRLAAPQELVDSFLQACEINASLPPDSQADFQSLLEEQCRRFGFHAILPEGWFFRPSALSGPSFRADIAVESNVDEAPAIEQAYRRGVAHGFALCRDLVDERNTAKIGKVEDQIQKWRVRKVQRFGTPPGVDERPPRLLFGGRRSISVRLRWQVFERDGFRCVACGLGASESAILEVDHIVAVAKGGFDTFENLRTLCRDCNRGKSDT